MYFESREQAGILLAKELVDKYRYDDCVVIALSDGAVLIGEQIAKVLHCTMLMLLIEEIAVPGESVDFGGLSQNGGFTYNKLLSAGELEDYMSEYHGYLDEQKRESFQRINRLLGDGGYIDNDMLRNRVVILVSDGFDSGSSLDVASDFLKPIKIKRLIVATPVSTVQAVDKMHIIADELRVLDVKSNFLGVNHYYENNTIPSHQESIAMIKSTILNWQ
jgi:predicted phosphoribosyltransferase